MGIRDWLFEKDEPEIDLQTLLKETEDIVEEVEVSNTEVDGLVENIYEENSLADKTASIFKVKEAIDALPKEMPAAQKVASVVSILQISNLSVEIVLADADNRLSILAGALMTINNLNESEVLGYEAEIEALSNKIAELHQSIYATKVRDEQSTTLINKEIADITYLVDFLGKEVK